MDTQTTLLRRRSPMFWLAAAGLLAGLLFTLSAAAAVATRV